MVTKLELLLVAIRAGIICHHFMALLSDILHGLHFHSFIATVIFSENASTYVDFVFIYKRPYKIFIYWLIFKFQCSTDSKETELSNDVMISIYHNILNADINIRQV